MRNCNAYNSEGRTLFSRSPPDRHANAQARPLTPDETRYHATKPPQTRIEKQRQGQML